MSGDGKSISIFCDLPPYYTKGLCVTHKVEVTICLQSSKGSQDNKVVIFGIEVEIIQNDRTGAPLYNDPQYTTSVRTAEVIVTDWSYPHRIIVDMEEQHLFTWAGEI